MKLKHKFRIGLAICVLLMGAYFVKPAQAEIGDVIAYTNEAGTEVFSIDQDGLLTVIALAITGAVTLNDDVTFVLGADEAFTLTCTDISAPVVMTNIMATAGKTGGRALFHVQSNVALGGWANGVKGYLEFTGTSGRVTGLASGVCAELKMPNTTLASGWYFPMEIEYVAGGTSTATAESAGNRVGFIYMRASGDDDGDFDDNGVLFVATSLTAGAGHVLSAGSQTLKVAVGTYGSESTRYLVMSDTENSLVMSATPATAIDIQGASTSGVSINTSTPTQGILISAACSTAAINITGAEAVGIQIATSTPVDGILISSACADAIHISGINTATGVNISGAMVVGTGVAITSTGTLTGTLKGIAIDYDGVTLGTFSNTGIEVLMHATYGGTGTEYAIYASGDGTTVALCSDAAAAITIGGTVTTDITFSSGATAKCTTNTLTIEEATLTFTGGTAINLDGATTVTGILTVDTSGSPADGILINATTPTDGLEISSATGSHAINISAAQTGAGITIASTCGTYGLNIAGACTTAAINIANGSAIGIGIGNVTTGITFTGTVVGAIDFADVTLTPNATRTNYALGIGDRNDELAILFGNAADQNLDPIQMAFDMTCTSTGPTNASTFNGIYQYITHDTTDMTYLRIKGLDWTISTDKVCQDAYVVQTELIVSGTKTSSGELMAVSALTTLGTGARTADRVCALQAMITGSGTAGTVVGDAIVAYLVNAGTVITTDDILKVYNQSAATVVEGIEIENDGTMTTAISINNDGTLATGISLVGAFTTAAISMDTATFSDGDHEIQLRNNLAGDKTVICSGDATDDTGIIADVGADADIVDGSLYMSCTDGAGVLFIKKNDVWTAFTNP